MTDGGPTVRGTFSRSIGNQETHHAPCYTTRSCGDGKDLAERLLRKKTWNLLLITGRWAIDGPISAPYSTDSIILFHKMFKEGVTKSPLWHVKKKKEKKKLNKASIE